MCRLFDVSRSGYYGFVSRMDIPAKDQPLVERIRECQEKCGRTYGYRRVHIWLDRQGVHYDPKTILRVMQKYNLLSVVRRKKYRNYGKYLHRYPNLLSRNFKSRTAESKVGHGYLLHQDRTRNAISIRHSRSIQQQYCGVQDRNGAKHQSGAKYHSCCQTQRKSHCRIAAPQ